MAVNSCSASVFRPVSAFVPAGRPAAAQLSDMTAWSPEFPPEDPGSARVPQPGMTAFRTDGLSRPSPTACRAPGRPAAGTVTQASGTATRRPWAGPPAHFCPAGSAGVAARGLLTEAYMACSAWVDRLPPLAQPVTARTRPAAHADTGSRAGMRLISDPPGGAAPGAFRAPEV